MNDDEKADEIVASVLARYKTASEETVTGMARATLVVDENVDFLGKPLKEANFHIVMPPKGMADEVIKRDLLPHRIIVTRNTKDFLDDAPVMEYGIIGLEALPFVDPASDYKSNTTAQIISAAISSFSLVSKRSGFVLMLKPNGKHTFRKLE